MSTSRFISSAVFVLALGAWFFVLRPVSLGGPASYLWVNGKSMLPTLETGDFVVTQQQQTYAVGDVLAYRIPKGQPGAGAVVIHRLIGGSPTDGFRLQGDNKNAPDEWQPRQTDVVGKMWVMIPGAGQYLQALRSPAVFAPLVAGIVVFLILLGGDPKPRSKPHEAVRP
ncbi:MAG TPA: signal peptidase I [Candidatus Limnocylindria bacterium]|nr:signal peptidase I [Candidatus Limnocylindria bacterium]